MHLPQKSTLFFWNQIWREPSLIWENVRIWIYIPTSSFWGIILIVFAIFKHICYVLFSSMFKTWLRRGEMDSFRGKTEKYWGMKREKRKEQMRSIKEKNRRKEPQHPTPILTQKLIKSPPTLPTTAFQLLLWLSILISTSYATGLLTNQPPPPISTLLIWPTCTISPFSPLNWLKSTYSHIFFLLVPQLVVYKLSRKKFNGKFNNTKLTELSPLPSSTRDYFVEMYYRNETHHEPYPLTLPGCTPSCPLTKFAELVAPVIPQDWSTECRITSKHEGTKDIGD